MSKKEKGMNLIICYTPLQVLIAEKIIEMYPDEEFFGVMVYAIHNKKYDYYAERLKKKCKIFTKISRNQRKGVKKFFVFRQLITDMKSQTIHRIFVANINELLIQSIISNISYDKLYSFDDGIANIIGTGLFYNEQAFTLRQKIARRFFNYQHTLQSLKNGMIDCHYTIYPNLPNIIENTKIIQLNPIHMLINIDKYVKENEKIIRIFLGQPLFDNDELNQKISKQVIVDYQINYYFPHPRERYQVDNVQYIDTPLVFEDYFIQNLANKPCIIYTLLSSAVLNIVNFENVEIIALKPTSYHISHSENILQIFNMVGIQVVDYKIAKNS